MQTFIRGTIHLLRDDSGQDIVEYALIACLIALGAIASIKNLTNGVKNVFTAVGTTLNSSV